MPVGSGLFILNGGTLTPMAEAPYDNENALQQLLAEHPELLPGDAMDPDDPRRFILVGREVQVAGYRLDHLFIDHEAVPTLVETKLEANREIRRLVVAQMLDYAANAASEWDAAKLSGWLADIAGGDTDALASLDHQFETTTRSGRRRSRTSATARSGCGSCPARYRTRCAASWSSTMSA
jgi:hypothetical protein